MRRRTHYRRRRWPRWLAMLVLALIVAAPLSLYLYLRASLPQISGTLRLEGPGEIIEIVRDRNGVPHIFARTEADGWFALGFVHAQDRLYQMEMMRRAGRGRLSEFSGVATIEADRYFRTLGLLQHAEAALGALSPEFRRQLDSYAAGVNAFLTQDPILPPEFAIAGLTPEPWRPVDSLLWGQLMTLQLAGNWRDELARARALTRQPAAQLEELWSWPADGSATTLATLYRSFDLDRLAAWLPAPLGPPTASNEWVLSGEHTASRKPLLANDPHLGLAAPGQWYLTRLVTPTLSLAGATAPGVPAVILGHNGRIAWGITTTNADQFDLFIERVAPDDPSRYLTPEGSRPFATRSETIKVRGQDDVVVTVRTTRHGPVLSDALRGLTDAVPPGHALALSSPAHYRPDRTAEAMFRLNRARHWDDFLEALGSWHAPMQNIVYADSDGHIGFVAPALLPHRKAGDGRLPRPGWSGEFDWDGFVPFEALPRAFDPPAGRLVNANNRIVNDDFPVFITRDWDTPYRAERIGQMLDAVARHDIASAEAMLADPVSLYARAVLARLDRLSPADERSRQAVARLRDWDGAMTRGRPEPLILHAWMRELQLALLADWPAEQLGVRGSERPEILLAALDGRSAFCRDRPDGCPPVVAGTLASALEKLTSRYGSDMAAWRWSRAHRAPFRHALFERLPVIRSWLTFDVPTDGDVYTVNRGAWRASRENEPFAHVHGAGYRAIYDLADLARSRFIVAPGQSGHPLSRHWGDLVTQWADGRHFTIAGERDSLAAQGQILRLEPR
ncbi:MAG: penicillin acylase family protein [Alphaproteobacteria bacterium]|nr:penicillin acylase family protein [Alphaproteobacteria bacterium]